MGCAVDPLYVGVGLWEMWFSNGRDKHSVMSCGGWSSIVYSQFVMVTAMLGSRVALSETIVILAKCCFRASSQTLEMSGLDC